MIIRMILNLLENAFKYGRSGEKEGSVKVGLSMEGNFACFRIEDRGPGIEYKLLEDIWERFYRIDSSRNLPGEGLGLAIVKAFWSDPLIFWNSKLECVQSLDELNRKVKRNAIEDRKSVV